MNAELSDFLYYYSMDENKVRYRKKWNIMSAVVPSPLKNGQQQYVDYLDSGDLKLLQQIQIQNNKK